MFSQANQDKILMMEVDNITAPGLLHSVRGWRTAFTSSYATERDRAIARELLHWAVSRSKRKLFTNLGDCTRKSIEVYNKHKEANSA